VPAFAHRDSFQCDTEERQEIKVQESLADSKVLMAQYNKTLVNSEIMGFSDRTVLTQGSQPNVPAESENMGEVDSQNLSKSDVTALIMEDRPSYGNSSGNNVSAWKMTPVMNVLAAIVFGDELAVTVVPPATSIEMQNSYSFGDQSELTFLPTEL
jgi:hypothetical protein